MPTRVDVAPKPGDPYHFDNFTLEEIRRLTLAQIALADSGFSPADPDEPFYMRACWRAVVDEYGGRCEAKPVQAKCDVLLTAPGAVAGQLFLF